jgi:hypothetical protein
VAFHIHGDERRDRHMSSLASCKLMRPQVASLKGTKEM